MTKSSESLPPRRPSRGAVWPEGEGLADTLSKTGVARPPASRPGRMIHLIGTGWAIAVCILITLAGLAGALTELRAGRWRAAVLPAATALVASLVAWARVHALRRDRDT